MLARRGAAVLLAPLVLATGCVGWRVKDVTPEETADTPPHAEHAVPARALADSEELGARLQAAGAFQSVVGWHAGAGIAPDEVDVLLEQKPTSEVWADSEHPFGVVSFVGSALLLPPFWITSFIYLPWSPSSQLSHQLLAHDLKGQVVATWSATPEIQLETQADGWDGIAGGQWQHDSRELARVRATKMLADRVARDGQLAQRFTRVGCPLAYTGSAFGRLEVDSSGAPYRHPTEPQQPTQTWEENPQAWQTYNVDHARWAALQHPPRQWTLSRLQYTTVGDNKTGKFTTPRNVLYSPVETAFGHWWTISGDGVNVQAFLRARAQSPVYLLQHDTLGQRPVTWLVTPYWTASGDQLMAELYDGDPQSGTAPREVVALGPLSQEIATTPTGYLQTELRLTGIRVVFENRRPVKVVVDESDPPLEPFLQLKAESIPQGRWCNHALVTAKNKTLPRVLRDSKSSELVDLATRLEQMCLDLSHEKELGKDDAQRLVERNQATDEKGMSSDELRELSLVYQGRIEIVKAILGAIKEEQGNRNR